MLQSIDTAIAFVVIMTVASLIVTTVVQMCSAGLSLRGKNLANALALTFQRIAPSLGGDAHRLAAKILSDPLLSDSTRTVKDLRAAAAAPERYQPWHFTDIRCATLLASAVRPEEVFAMLRRLAAMAEHHAVEGKQVGALGGPDERVAKAASNVLEALHVFGAEAGSARGKFEAWFRSAEDRAQQWFQLHTRGLTIAASALIALTLQLDAVEIFHFVSTNAAQRAALVGRAERTIEQADGALDERGGLVQRIAAAWASKTGRAVNLAGILHVGQLEELLAREDPKFDRNEFDMLVKTITTTYFEERRATLRDLTREVSATGFEFIPENFWRWPAEDSQHSGLKNVVPHLPGIALCAALLTLGAPYWYNLLKNLMSLRPAVAQLIGDGRRRDDDKRG